MFGPVFCISILEIRGTQIISHSLDFNAFYIIQHYFCQFFLNFLKLRRGDLISLEGPIQQGGRIIWSSSLLYFNFRNLRNPNSSSLIGFPCILHDSAVLFSVFGDFLGVGGGASFLRGGAVLRDGWVIWFPLLCFNFSYQTIILLSFEIYLKFPSFLRS